MELRAKPNNVFQKDFFKLMNDSVSGKTVENVGNHKDLKFITTDSRISHLMLEQNYHTKKCFSKNLLPLEMNKTKIKMDKPVYLGLSLLDIRKIVMYECWYGYAKPEYGVKTKLSYTDTGNVIVHVTWRRFCWPCRSCCDKIWYIKLCSWKVTSRSFSI